MNTDTKRPALNRRTLALAALGFANLAAVAHADPTPPALAATATAVTPAAEPGAPAAQPYGKKADKSFATRLAEAELEQLGTPVFTPSPLPPPRTLLPAHSRYT